MTLVLLAVSIVAYAAMLWVDKYRPARRMPEIKGPWRAWGAFFLALTIAVNGGLPHLMQALIGTRHLFEGARLGDLGGAAVGFLLYQLAVYWLHRAHHRFNFLWRWVHQMHHAPERMDPAGMSFFHPSEILILGCVSALFYGPLLGLTPEAAGTAGMLFVFTGMFEHSNIRTPQWLGYFIQRPEQHGVHHERGVHRHNYSELPLWDLLFGTFRNPEAWDAEAGLFDRALDQWPRLLAGADLNASGAVAAHDARPQPL